MGTARRDHAGLSFALDVWRLVREVPRGRVVTYGQVAAMLGHPRAARGVGRAMGECPDDVPWHRVVNAVGAISRRARVAGMLTQRLRLEQEGVKLRRGRVPLSRYRWEGRPRRRRSATGRDHGTVTRRGGATCGWRST